MTGDATAGRPPPTPPPPGSPYAPFVPTQRLNTVWELADALKQPKWGRERYIFAPGHAELREILWCKCFPDRLSDGFRRVGANPKLRVCVVAGYRFPKEYPEACPLTKPPAGDVVTGESKELRDFASAVGGMYLVRSVCK